MDNIIHVPDILQLLFEMSGFFKKIEFLSSISENFVQKPNPYVPDATRESIKFK